MKRLVLLLAALAGAACEPPSMALRAPTIASTGAHETGSFVGVHGTNKDKQKKIKV